MDKQLVLKDAWEKRLKLFAEGKKLWEEAVVSTHGNIQIEWFCRGGKDSHACALETGEVFEP